MENEFDTMAAREQIAYRVKKEREAQNLTKAALAEIAGVAGPTIGQLENNLVFSLDVLLKVADALYVPMSVLLGEEDMMVKHYEERINELEKELHIWRKSDELEEAYKRIEKLEAENKYLSQFEWTVKKIKIAVGAEITQ